MTKKKLVKKSAAFESTRQGLIEARAYARGKTAGARVHEVRVAAPDVAAIRAKTGLSQTVFAKSIGVAVGTLQGWEQGRRHPDGRLACFWLLSISARASCRTNSRRKREDAHASCNRLTRA